MPGSCHRRHDSGFDGFTFWTTTSINIDSVHRLGLCCGCFAITVLCAQVFHWLPLLQLIAPCNGRGFDIALSLCPRLRCTSGLGCRFSTGGKGALLCNHQVVVLPPCLYSGLLFVTTCELSVVPVLVDRNGSVPVRYLWAGRVRVHNLGLITVPGSCLFPL